MYIKQYAKYTNCTVLLLCTVKIHRPMIRCLKDFLSMSMDVDIKME